VCVCVRACVVVVSVLCVLLLFVCLFVCYGSTPFVCQNLHLEIYRR